MGVGQEHPSSVLQGGGLKFTRKDEVRWRVRSCLKGCWHGLSLDMLTGDTMNSPMIVGGLLASLAAFI